jgi:hypothetical protein
VHIGSVAYAVREVERDMEIAGSLMPVVKKYSGCSKHAVMVVDFDMGRHLEPMCMAVAVELEDIVRLMEDGKAAHIG